jgi:hypothetical protein
LLVLHLEHYPTGCNILKYGVLDAWEVESCLAIGILPT